MDKNNTYIYNTIKIIMCFIPFLLTIVFHIFKINNEENIKYFMQFTLICIAVYTLWLTYKGKLTADKLIWVVLIAGIILRWGYAEYTPVLVRTHDMYNRNDPGHYGYLNLIMQNKLPPSNVNQFYHPPFYYILSSMFIRVAMLFTSGVRWDNYFYLAQMVSCTASCVGLTIFAFIMDELKIKKCVQIIPLIITAVYPAQIIFSGVANNDALVFMFIMLSLYATVLWAKKRTMVNIILIAVFIGFGMMTKISCGVVAFITGPVMIYWLVRYIKEKDMKKIGSIILQLCIFAVIVFPLGLWYPIRNMILFDQPLNYVYLIDKRHPVYSGNLSFFERWIKFPLFSFVNKPYIDVLKEKNIIQSLIQTGVHGEFNWSNDISDLLAWGIDYVHIFLILCVGAAIIVVMFKDKDLSKMQKWSVFAVWAIWTVMYIQFNEAYKYSCSANFRYLLPVQPAAAVFVGYLADFLKRKNTGLCRISSYGVYGIVYLFSVMSILHFI